MTSGSTAVTVVVVGSADVDSVVVDSTPVVGEAVVAGAVVSVVAVVATADVSLGCVAESSLAHAATASPITISTPVLLLFRIVEHRATMRAVEQDPATNALLARHRVPGAAWAIVDTVHWTTATAGVDPATGQPVAPDTRFQIGSLSKTFCALVGCLLVDGGTVPWDDDLGGWAPETNAILERHGHAGAVTVA
ncbi:MAG: serine hydrolase domain-containing protein, partial [Actinomycetota bacterium]